MATRDQTKGVNPPQRLASNNPNNGLGRINKSARPTMILMARSLMVWMTRSRFDILKN